MIATHCPHCRSPLTVEERHAGAQLQCPHCRRNFTASGNGAEEPAQTPAVARAAWLVVAALALAATVGVALAGVGLLYQDAWTPAGLAAWGRRFGWVAALLALLLPAAVLARAVDGACR